MKSKQSKAKIVPLLSLLPDPIWSGGAVAFWISFVALFALTKQTNANTKTKHKEKQQQQQWLSTGFCVCLVLPL